MVFLLQGKKERLRSNNPQLSQFKKTRYLICGHL